MKNSAVTAVAGMMMASDSRKPGSARSNNISAPRKNETIPPTVNTPCVGAYTSTMNNATARPIKANPATFTGKIADM